MANENIGTLGNHVLVQTVTTPTKTNGGIHLPEQFQQPPGEGMVVGVGPGKLDYAGRRVPPGVSIGEVVVFNWLHAREVDDGRTKYKLIDAVQILAVKRERNTQPKEEVCLVECPTAA